MCCVHGDDYFLNLFSFLKTREVSHYLGLSSVQNKGGGSLSGIIQWYTVDLYTDHSSAVSRLWECGVDTA